MIECHSYVIEERNTYLIGKKKDIFIPIYDYKENLILSKIFSNSYINGFISLKIDGIDVLGEEYWDDIFCLWGYFIDALSQIVLEDKRKVSFWFPDQPIFVKLETNNHQILININEKLYECSIYEFISTFLCEAKYFFDVFHHFNHKYDLINESDLVKKLLTYSQKFNEIK